MAQLEKELIVNDCDVNNSGGRISALGETVDIDERAEKRVLSKFDWVVMPQMSILVLFAYLDRTNIGNARVFGFEKSLGMSGTDFNNISMFFYIPYILLETPWVMVVRKFGPGRVLAIAIVCWSGITIGSGFAKNYNQIIACRLLLGSFEAGLFPSLTFVISRIYPATSQGKRIAVLYISIALSGALGGLIAYGIQSMGKQHGLEAWRWLFIIEGTITLVVGALCWVSLPTTPETAWFLGQEDRSTMSIIKFRNHPFEVSDRFSWKQVAMALTDPLVWLAAVSLFCSSIAMFGFSTFLPTLLTGMNYTSLQANYLSIPVYVLASICTGITTFVSDRIKRRAICLIHSPLLVMAGYAITVGTGNKSVGFFAMFLVGAGVYSYNTVVLTWVSNNIHPDYKRSVAIAVVISIGNAAGLAASQIYPIRDEPRYLVGNSLSLGFETLALLSVGITTLLLKYRMKQKKRLRDEGIESNGKEGDQSLGFKYVL
ncbi:transporter [Tolypocladium capitatum]|uniref:Transporter n=1 Tax=Tolypocladium capitatum TaxID=45235 RepID=A0A2K3Q829_9HYPO|nr:transporter [Tolypocladium capitatum]